MCKTRLKQPLRELFWTHGSIQLIMYYASVKINGERDHPKMTLPLLGEGESAKRIGKLTMVFSLMDPKDRIKSSQTTRVGVPILFVGVARRS